MYDQEDPELEALRGQKRRERHLWQALPASLDGEIISAAFLA